MSQFVKIENQIYPKPKGTDYDLIPGKCYSLITSDGWDREIYLSEDSNIQLDVKHLYETEKDILFKKRVIRSFKNSPRTTGVLLSGLKGSGKTLAAKQICQAANLPIIVVDPSFDSRDLNQFFTKFDIPVAIIFDEVDKNIDKKWDTAQMLSFLDGMQDTGKKLVIFICNDMSKLDDNLLDRCSRIRYFKCYDALDKDTVATIVQDVFNTDVKILTDFIMNNIKTINYDNVISFVNEVHDYCNDGFTEKDLENIIDDMNIELK